MKIQDTFGSGKDSKFRGPISSNLDPSDGNCTYGSPKTF